MTGLVIWLGATIVLRFAGQYLLRSGGWVTVIVLFAISFAAMSLLARHLCRSARLAPEEWPRGAISLTLPTLLLDPFSSAFFSTVFPNMPAGLAGVFGGWMLVCCAGALTGAIVGPRRAV